MVPGSALAHTTPWDSADHLIRLEEDSRRGREPEGLGNLEVNDQLKRGRLLNRQVGRRGAFEDLVHVGCRTPMPRSNGS